MVTVGAFGRGRRRERGAYLSKKSRREGGNTSSRGFADELSHQQAQWQTRWASPAAPPIKTLALSLIQEGLYLDAPAITGETVAFAARKFSGKTAWGPDGLHVRQCALLSQPL